MRRLVQGLEHGDWVAAKENRRKDKTGGGTDRSQDGSGKDQNGWRQELREREKEIGHGVERQIGETVAEQPITTRIFPSRRWN